MAIIKHKYSPIALSFEDKASEYLTLLPKLGGYDPKAKTVTPMKVAASQNAYYYLDAVAGAVEAGLVEDETWPAQLFKTKKDLKAFIEGVESYEEDFRINDRWYQALATLGEFQDGEGTVSGESIAEALAERADELEAF